MPPKTFRKTKNTKMRTTTVIAIGAMVLIAINVLSWSTMCLLVALLNERRDVAMEISCISQLQSCTFQCEDVAAGRALSYSLSEKNLRVEGLGTQRVPGQRPS